MARKPITYPPEVEAQLLGLRRRIAEARERAGITQEQLAELIGPHAVTISRIETGKQAVSVAALLQIAEGLGTTVSELLQTAPNDADSTALGLRIAETRERAHHTQAELADKLGGVSEVTVARIEAGEVSLSVETLLRIARCLNVNAAALLTREEESL